MLQDNLLSKSILDKFTITSGLQITCLDKNNNFIAKSSFSNHSLLKEDLNFSFQFRNRLKNYADTKMIEFIKIDDTKELALIYINLNDEIN